MTVDRSIAPKPQIIETFNFLEPEVFTLNNGVAVYALRGGEQEIIKTDLVFDSGSLLASKPLIALTANDLLFTTANGKTSEQIANQFDDYGAFNSKTSTYTDSVITNYSLSKHLPKVYTLLAETIEKAEFTKNELDTYKFVKIQHLKVSKEKTSFLARRAFASALFPNHPYGIISEEEDYKNLTTEALESFYQSHKKLKYIVVSGAYTAQTIQELNRAFGNFEKSAKIIPSYSLSGSNNKKIHIPKADATQSTVRMGFKTINRTHADYPKLGILVTLLGGFFGSRLMKNIREDKGYTYGIHAGIVSYPDCGLFYVQTDVRKEVYQNTINEIFVEINRLKNEAISDDELHILSNYSLGSFLRSIDGAFAVSEKYKTLLDFGQDYNYYHNYIRLLKNINKEELMEIANKYFVEDNIYEVVAGV